MVPLVNPGDGSFAANNLSIAYDVGDADWSGVNSGWTYNFTPVVLGTYYVAIGAFGTSQNYTLSVKTVGR